MVEPLNWCRFTLGLVFSVVGGQIVLWPLIEKCLYGHRAAKKFEFNLEKKSRLSWLVGMIERLLYTGALVFGVKEWIGVWLAIKIAARWQSKGEKETEKQDSDNIWLIGTGLSVLFGWVGACIALWHRP